MKIFKRFLMGLGTVLLLALSLQLVAPKAVHAVVSTLVTVANTAADPVPVHSVDSQPQLQTFDFLADCDAPAQQACTQTLGQVPKGMTAVVQDVSADCFSSNINGVAGPPPGALTVSSIGAGVGGNLFLHSVFQQANATSAEYVFARQTTAYFPSSSLGPANLFFTVTGPTALGCQIVIEGYYIPSNVILAPPPPPPSL
jgi:hypothetical protein